VSEPAVAPGLAPPWWLEEALASEPAVPDAPRLQGDAEVDVAVVGGGYTGLWTALALREREPTLRIAVLEREIVGWGPSGRNGGFLHGFTTRVGKLRALVGDAGALEIVRAGKRIAPAVAAFCERRGEDVWLRPGGYLKVSASPAQDAVLDKVLEAASGLGLEEEAVPLSREEVAERIGSPVFRRAVFFRDCVTVQPARLARALRRAVLDEGIALHERTPVVAIEPGRPNELHTPAGRVRAGEVVLAINAALAGWRPASGLLTNFSSYIVLTEPVPELLERIGWTGGEAVTDARSLVHYFRTTPDCRIVMGAGGGPIGYGGRIDGRLTAVQPGAARAEKALRRLLPGLAEARVTHAWGGPIDVSADHIPFFDTLPSTRIHYGAGYSGSGVGPSWLGGQILASLALGLEDEWTALPLVGRRIKRLPGEPLRSLGGRLVRAALLACEEAEDEGRRGPLLARAVVRVPSLIGMEIGTR
jgi:glycine/D-amino acid oxidase-like deaminating enzyme